MIDQITIIMYIHDVESVIIKAEKYNNKKCMDSKDKRKIKEDLHNIALKEEKHHKN